MLCFLKHVIQWLPMHKRIPKDKLPEAHEMVIELLRTVRAYTKASHAKCIGQCTIERVKQPPTVVMYASYPNGDYLCWFNDGTKFQLYALVNEKFKHVFTCDPCDLPKLIEKAQDLEGGLGK